MKHKLTPTYRLILVFIGTIVFSYVFLDRELVVLAVDYQTRTLPMLSALFELLSNAIPALSVAFSVLILLYTLISFLLNSPFKQQKLIHIANLVALGTFCKSVLKDLLNRYFPDTWFCQNPSYLQDGLYGFGPLLNGIKLNSSMPSGHITVTTTFLLGLSVFYPRCKPWAWPLILLTAFGQVILYYHFLSDTLLAMLLGLLIVRVYKHQLDMNQKPSDLL